MKVFFFQFLGSFPSSMKRRRSPKHQNCRDAENDVENLETVNVMKPYDAYETLTNLTTCPDFYLKLEEWTHSVRKQYKQAEKMRQFTARSFSPDKSYKS